MSQTSGSPSGHDAQLLCEREHRQKFCNTQAFSAPPACPYSNVRGWVNCSAAASARLAPPLENRIVTFDRYAAAEEPCTPLGLPQSVVYTAGTASLYLVHRAQRHAAGHGLGTHTQRKESIRIHTSVDEHVITPKLEEGRDVLEDERERVCLPVVGVISELDGSLDF